MDLAPFLAAAALALVVQRQRVLARRIARLERRMATAPPGHRTRHVVTLRATGFHPQTAARFVERRRMHRADG